MPRRIVIIGGPRVGKTTLSELLKDEFRIPAHHTSAELESLFPADRPESWSKQSEHAAKWFDDSGDWICEGVQMARALRKWLRAHPNEPLDVDILTLKKPFETRLKGQESMAKGVDTVFREIEKDLIRRGARIHKLDSPDNAIEVLNSVGPKVGERRMALPKSYTKAEWDALPEAKRLLYIEDEIYVADGENWKKNEEDVAGLKASQTKLLDEYKKLQQKADAFKDVDPEKYRQMLAEAEEREHQDKKDAGDWDGWKKGFEESKAKELKTLQDQIAARDTRIRKFLLEDKVRAAALEAGVRKESLERVVRDVLHPDRPRFRLDDKENIEVLADSGNPLDLKIDSFFKDIYSQEAAEMYAASKVGGTGSSNGNSASLGGADLSKLSPTERLKVANRASAT